MISRKTLGILAVILIVLGLLATLTGKSRYSTDSSGGFVTILEGIDPSSVQSIRAWLGSAPDSAVDLARSGDGWVVASRWDWKAKDDLVKRLLDDLSGLKGEKRASTGELLADFQADDENGLHLVGSGTGGTELFHLVVGKSAPRGGTFVRREGSDDIYITQAALRSSFGVWGDEPKPPDAKRWIELRVYQGDRMDVDRVDVRDGSRDLVLEKEFAMVEPAPPAPAEGDSAAAAEPAPSAEPVPDRSDWTWKPDQAGEFDKNKVDGILGTLCSLYAFDVADPDSVESYGLVDPSRSVEIDLQDGSKVDVYFGKATEDGKKVYFRVGKDGKPALIYSSTVDRIFAKREDLKPQA